jgi:TonB family protein
VQQAPAAKAPEMTIPEKNARRATGANVREAPDDARGRTPTKGAETSAGSAAAFTGARGQGFGGLSNTGPGAGVGAMLDVADFCCPQYLIDMRDRIQRNWNDHQNIPANVVVRFVIVRSGDITEATVERSSGYTALDLEALRAVQLTKQLAPLPAGYSYSTLPVHLTFQYQK